MKKRIVLSALLAMCMTLSACGAAAESPSPSPAAPSPEAPVSAEEPAASETPVEAEAPVEILFAGWSGEEEGSKAIFTEMREGFGAASGNTVSWLGWPWADVTQQILIRSQGGEKMDIAQVDISIFATLAQTDILADFNEVVGEDYMKENFDAASLAVGNRDGKQLGMPWSMASITVVYNPEILAAAGWEEPPATVAEFEQCLADIAASNPDVIPYAVSTKDSTTARDFVPWLWTYGGSIFDEGGNVAINSPAAVQCVEWYQSLLAKNYIRMDMSRFDARQMFAQGKVAFYDDAVVAKGTAVSNGVAPEQVSEVCSAMLRPVVTAGDQPQSYMWGHMLVMFENSDLKAQSAEFAKYLVGEEIAPKYFEQNGMPPVLKSITESPEIQNDPYTKGFLKATETSRLEETAMMSNGGEINTIITEELQAALLGGKTAAQAMEDAAARINSAM